MQKAMENIGSCCPSVNTLMHVAISLPEDVPILTTRACPHFPCTSRVPLPVRGATIPEMQKLLRRHADDEWPMAFASLSNRERRSDCLKPLLPSRRGRETAYSVCPFCLCFRPFDPQAAFIHFPPDRMSYAVFHIREHLHFDADWFERRLPLSQPITAHRNTSA